MEILFYIVPILIGITFIMTIALMVSPKLRGKLMSRQIKATKHMMDYSKEDLKDILSTSADIGINAEKEILDNNEETMMENATRKANINKKGIEITANAIKEGLNGSKIYCKHCGKLIDEDSKFCKSCGKEQ
jgi:rRNA maturation endonuclease Nob1